MKALTGLFTGFLIVNTGRALRAGPLRIRALGPFRSPLVEKVEEVAAAAVKDMVFDESEESVGEDAVAQALIKMRDIADPPPDLASGLRRLARFEG
jgi:hypothetical protein